MQLGAQALHLSSPRSAFFLECAICGKVRVTYLENKYGKVFSRLCTTLKCGRHKRVAFSKERVLYVILRSLEDIEKLVLVSLLWNFVGWLIKLIVEINQLKFVNDRKQ